MLKPLILKIIVESCKLPCKPCKENAKQLLDHVQPKPADGGFVEIRFAVMCQCGGTIMGRTSPDTDDMQELVKAAETTQQIENGPRVVMSGEPSYPGQRPEMAANMGGLPMKCPKCGTKYICAWEFDCAKVSNEVEFVADAPESPEHPSSGSSMTEIPPSETIH